MKQALEKKDQDLVASQKEAREKTTLADKKLASVRKSEEENSKLKTNVIEANKEVASLREDKEALTDKVGDPTAKKGELEAYLRRLAEKLVLKLEGTSSHPTDLLLSTHCLTIDSLLFRLCRTLSRLRSRDWADQDKS